MTAAIVHYHLRPGGVTRVIREASRGLSAAGIRHAILSGTPPENADLPSAVVEGLDYLPGTPCPNPETLEKSARRAAERLLGESPSVWHFHNPFLGKNTSVPNLVHRLAEAGERLVLHVHDLAEDGRPSNYRLLPDKERIHPLSPRIHYAFLNRRDRDRFVAAGLLAEHAHILPNPLPGNPPSAPGYPPGQPPLLFYPVRGIRRKNLGEILLLAALSPLGTRFAIASAPDNPQWRAIHDDWRDFATEHSLPVEFAVAGRLPPAAGQTPGFTNWLTSATHLATTSVMEGFGYVFLDSIALQKPLIGRSIPHLTNDHRDHGIRFPSLYDQILIPAETIDIGELENLRTKALSRMFTDYGMPFAAGASLSTPSAFDFGNLPEPIQKNIILHFLSNPADQPTILAGGNEIPARQWLRENLTKNLPPPPPGLLKPFSTEAHTARLLDMYAASSNSPRGPVTWLNSSALLKSCLDPSAFQFLSSP